MKNLFSLLGIHKAQVTNKSYEKLGNKQRQRKQKQNQEMPQSGLR